MYYYQCVDISAIEPGDVLSSPIFDDSGTKLLDIGCVIDNSTIHKLRCHNVSEVMLRKIHQQPRRVHKTVAYTGVYIQECNEDQPVTIIDRCTRCNHALPLKALDREFTLQSWICVGCGAMYFASFNRECRGVHCELTKNCSRITCSHVRRVKYQLAPQKCTEFSPYIHTIARGLAGDSYPGQERRESVRRNVQIPVVCLPLDESFQVDGEPFEARTRNISKGGASLIYSRAVNKSYLVLDFSQSLPNGLQAVLKLMRVHPCGIYYELAGNIIGWFKSEPEYPV